MISINGDKWECSAYCLDEEADKYQFVDTARFALANCVHASPHLQCLVSRFIADFSITYCPVMDTPQCHGYDQGAYGEAHFWAPEDFYNFARAFLSTKALTQVFLKPKYR